MPSHTPAQTLGSRGEQLAAQYLQDKGYTIIERNFTVHKVGEIDLITKKGDEIVFIEVKTRTGIQYGYPEEAVDWRKMKKISRAAQYFLSIKHLHYAYIRFDVISVHIHDKNQLPTITHIEDVSFE